MPRVLSPYEKNQLLKYGLGLDLPDTDHTPVEYLTGHAEFAGLDFLVNRHTLIPRIETQEILPLIQDRLPLLRDISPLLIADLGTGSGALGISLSVLLTQLHLDHQLYLSDISAPALNLAYQNAHRLLPPTHQPTLIKSDLFDDYPPLRFHIVTANLPYIPSSRLPDLDPSVKDYEPTTALDGGPDGAQVINSLLAVLDQYTHTPSLTILEIDHTHQLHHFQIPPRFNPEFFNDSFGFRRFLLLSKT